MDHNILFIMKNIHTYCISNTVRIEIITGNITSDYFLDYHIITFTLAMA